MTGFLLAFFIAVNGSAQEDGNKSRRIEASVSFEHLSPHDIYGNWYSSNVGFYSKVSPSYTYFIQGSFHNRPEGSGMTMSGGCYKDWKDFLYTYSAVSAGSHSDYLPEFRIDHDFNFKLGRDKNYVLTAGVIYIDYFTGHTDLIFSGGTTVYLNKWIFQYRLFHNQSNPGSIGSFSHLLSAGYGEEGMQWTYVNISFGKQAYLATSLVTPQAVNQNSWNISLQHRRWIGKSYGIFSDASFFRLEDGYDKFGVSCGVFYEF
jgi:YaiO family outer membrane protein